MIYQNYNIFAIMHINDMTIHIKIVIMTLILTFSCADEKWFFKQSFEVDFPVQQIEVAQQNQILALSGSKIIQIYLENPIETQEIIIDYGGRMGFGYNLDDNYIMYQKDNLIIKQSLDRRSCYKLKGITHETTLAKNGLQIYYFSSKFIENQLLIYNIGTGDKKIGPMIKSQKQDILPGIRIDSERIYIIYSKYFYLIDRKDYKILQRIDFQNAQMWKIDLNDQSKYVILSGLRATQILVKNQQSKLYQKAILVKPNWLHSEYCQSGKCMMIDFLSKQQTSTIYLKKFEISILQQEIIGNLTEQSTFVSLCQDKSTVFMYNDESKTLVTYLIVNGSFQHIQDIMNVDFMSSDIFLMKVSKMKKIIALIIEDVIIIVWTRQKGIIFQYHSEYTELILQFNRQQTKLYVKVKDNRQFFYLDLQNYQVTQLQFIEEGVHHFMVTQSNLYISNGNSVIQYDQSNYNLINQINLNIVNAVSLDHGFICLHLRSGQLYLAIVNQDLEIKRQIQVFCSKSYTLKLGVYHVALICDYEHRIYQTSFLKYQGTFFNNFGLINSLQETSQPLYRFSTLTKSLHYNSLLQVEYSIINLHEAFPTKPSLAVIKNFTTFYFIHQNFSNYYLVNQVSFNQQTINHKIIASGFDPVQTAIPNSPFYLSGNYLIFGSLFFQKNIYQISIYDTLTFSNIYNKKFTQANSNLDLRFSLQHYRGFYFNVIGELTITGQDMICSQYISDQQVYSINFVGNIYQTFIKNQRQIYVIAGFNGKGVHILQIRQKDNVLAQYELKQNYPVTKIEIIPGGLNLIIQQQNKILIISKNISNKLQDDVQDFVVVNKHQAILLMLNGSLIKVNFSYDNFDYQFTIYQPEITTIDQSSLLIISPNKRYLIIQHSNKINLYDVSQELLSLQQITIAQQAILARFTPDNKIILFSNTSKIIIYQHVICFESENKKLQGDKCVCYDSFEANNGSCKCTQGFYAKDNYCQQCSFFCSTCSVSSGNCDFLSLGGIFIIIGCVIILLTIILVIVRIVRKRKLVKQLRVSFLTQESDSGQLSQL